MKKEYTKPSMEAVAMRYEWQILAGSVTGVSSNDIFDDVITGGSGTGRAPLFDGPEWDELLGE